MVNWYKRTDVKLDGTPTARTLYRVEDITDGLDSDTYQTKQPKHTPTTQEIGWLEDDLGFKLSSEYKEFLVKRGAVQYDDFHTVGIPKSGTDDFYMSVNSIMDDIEEHTGSSSTKIPKDAVPLIDAGSSGIVLYLNNSKKIGYWESGVGYLGSGPANTIDEAMLDELLK